MSTATRSVAMPPANDVISQSELEHLWGDPQVSDESCRAISEGRVRHFVSCPTDVVQSLNRWAFENETASKEWWDEAAFDKNLGIELVEPKMVAKLDSDGNPMIDPETGEILKKPEPQPYDFSVKVGKGDIRKYRMTKNNTNRPLSEDSGKALCDQFFSRGRWAMNGETMIFDSLGNAVSAQHRAYAGKRAYLLNPELDPVPVWVVRNTPALLADTADTGRARTTAHILTRDPEVMAVDELEDARGKSYGEEAIKKREKLVGSLASVLTALRYRCIGKDVNASGPDKSEIRYLYDRFDESLDHVVNAVDARQQTFGSGTTAFSPVKLLGKEALATAIILAQLSDHEPLSEVDGRKRVITQPEPDDLESITLDVDRAIEVVERINSDYEDDTGVS